MHKRDTPGINSSTTNWPPNTSPDEPAQKVFGPVATARSSAPTSAAPQPLPRRLSINEFCAWANIGRTHLYALIRRGDIKARKDGRRTYILIEDGEAWISSLPTVGAESAFRQEKGDLQK